MCQSVNLLGKIAAGYVFPNFFADTKIVFRYNFAAPLTWISSARPFFCL